MHMAFTHIISRYSGMSFTKFAQERIFDRLGMSYTTYSPVTAEGVGHFSHSWATNGRRIPFYQSDKMIHTFAGPQGLISNVVDLV